MTTLKESWIITKRHLRKAVSIAGLLDLDDFHDYLNHNELELAADVLTEEGLDRGDLPGAFWDALYCSYNSMKLEKKAQQCADRRDKADAEIKA